MKPYSATTTVVRIKHALRVSAISVCLAFLCACSSTKLPDYAGSPSPQALTIESNGVAVTLDSFADKARCETYFDLNAPAAGIAIFHVSLANRSPDTAWLLHKDRCKLLLSGADSSQAGANTSRSTAPGEAVAITGALLAGLGTTPLLLAIANGQIKHATTVQRNFTEKELRDKTLSPGQSVEGFLYFKMPAKNAPFSGTLEFSLISTPDQHTNTLQIPVKYETK